MGGGGDNLIPHICQRYTSIAKHEKITTLFVAYFGEKAVFGSLAETELAKVVFLLLLLLSLKSEAAIKSLGRPRNEARCLIGSQ